MYLTFFFFNDTATTEIYTLSLHDALPIWERRAEAVWDSIALHTTPSIAQHKGTDVACCQNGIACEDRKSTRLNSSHLVISYAVFCLKKKTYATAPHSVPPTGTTTPMSLVS